MPWWRFVLCEHILVMLLVVGPMVWNVLPDDLRDPSLSAENFRKTLKTHLFRNALGHLAH